jgi:hypothetical protein
MKRASKKSPATARMAAISGRKKTESNGDGSQDLDALLAAQAARQAHFDSLIKYADDADGFREQTRKMLEGHDKKWLVEHALSLRMDYEWVDRAYMQCKAKIASERMIPFDIHEKLTKGKLGLEECAEWLQGKYPNLYMWLILKQAAAIPKAKISKVNRKNASKPRTENSREATPEKIKKARDEWQQQNPGKVNGMVKHVASKLEISVKVARAKLNNIAP